MALNFIKYRWQKTGFVIVLILLSLILISVLFINTILTPKLSEKVKDAVLKGTDSLYQINFSKAELHVFKGRAVLYNISLMPDTAVYHQMKLQGKAPISLYELKVKRLIVSEAHLFSFFFKKEADVGLITLNNPQIQLSRYSNKKAYTSSKDKRTLYQKISKSLKLIHVGEIQLNDINFIYKDYTGNKSATSELKKMNLKATDLLIDSATQTDTTRTLFCKDIVTKLYNFSGTSPKRLYVYKVNSITLSTRTSKLNVQGIDLKPLNTKTFFKSGEDRFTIHADSLAFNNFNLQTYYNKQSLEASSISVKKGYIEVYSNPNAPLTQTNKIITFPHWNIRQLKFGLNLDTLNVKNIAVTYKQYNKDLMKTGAVWFTNTSGRFINISNKKDILKKNNICTVKLSTYFMSKGKLDLLFAFNLTDATYNYSYQGHLGSMDMQVTNAAVMPLGLVKINSGQVKSLDFNIHSTQKKSTGKVSLLYNNLNISMLNNKSKEYDKKPLLSLLANSIIIKHNNPDDGSTVPRVANVAYMRPANSPFFETVWLTLLKGIKACAGVGKAKEKDAKKPMTEKEKKEQKKSIKKALKAKEKEEKEFKKKLKEQAEKKQKDN